MQKRINGRLRSKGFGLPIFDRPSTGSRYRSARRSVRSRFSFANADLPSHFEPEPTGADCSHRLVAIAASSNVVSLHRVENSALQSPSNRVEAFVVSLRATAVMLEERIFSEEELSGFRDPGNGDYPETTRAMRERLSNLRATISKLEAAAIAG